MYWVMLHTFNTMSYVNYISIKLEEKNTENTLGERYKAKKPLWKIWETGWTGILEDFTVVCKSKDTLLYKNCRNRKCKLRTIQNWSKYRHSMGECKDRVKWTCLSICLMGGEIAETIWHGSYHGEFSAISNSPNCYLSSIMYWLCDLSKLLTFFSFHFLIKKWK